MRGVFLSIPAILLFGAAAQAPAHPRQTQKAVTAEARKAVVRQAIQAWQSGRADLIEALVTPDYIGHPSSGDRNLDGLRKRISDFHKLYPDVAFKIEDQVAEGDRVTTRMTAVATSALTGKRVKLVGLNLSRFAGARIAEEWPVWEQAP